jgi:peptidoglycan/LPS O-acetylase OafA/YrhL
MAMDMDLISKLFVLPILLLALGTMWIVAPIIGIEAPKHRYAAIDGLRGFLALFVFLHHASSWYYFARIHEWSIIPSSLYNQFGSTSVAMFFMITAFLFFSKLIDSYGKRFDWLKLYVSRVVRIMPLYLTAVVLLFIVVGFVTHFTLHESLSSLLLQFGKWIMIMEPNVNHLNGTKFIICGVQWSLAYEWLFYCSLAFFGLLFFRLKPSFPVILTAAIFFTVFALIIGSYYSSRVWLRLWPFAGGLIAAFVVRNAKVRSVFADVLVTPVLLLLIYVGVFLYPLIFSFVPLVCMTVVFIGIACGNSLFGLLTWKPCRQLGQISYSVYLLHGLVLFSTFYFAIGFGQAASFSILQHWITICVCCVLVVIFCSFTYYYIEKPGTDSAAGLTRKIRAYFGLKMPVGKEPAKKESAVSEPIGH